MNIVVFGGSGFIGSRFIHAWNNRFNSIIVNVDKLTYAADQSNLNSISSNKNYFFYNHDINDTENIIKIISKHKPDILINFAAETHVDNSINSSYEFIKSNVMGTQSLLDIFKSYIMNYKSSNMIPPKFIQVSTDEVYGDLSLEDDAFTETSPYRPNNPYSASKASSEHLCMAYRNTYKLPIFITNCSNNYGPNQHLEKLIPKTIKCILNKSKMSVYGNGTNIRDWIYVDDHCDALINIATGSPKCIKYNIGGNNEISNIDIVKKICAEFKNNYHIDIIYENLIEYVDDRPGHDFRYAIDNNLILNEFKWKPITNFNRGLKATIDYYINKLNRQ